MELYFWLIIGLCKISIEMKFLNGFLLGLQLFYKEVKEIKFHKSLEGFIIRIDICRGMKKMNMINKVRQVLIMEMGFWRIMIVVLDKEEILKIYEYIK